MKQLGQQLSKLGVSAGLDLSDMSCEFDVKEVMEAFKTKKSDAILAGLVCDYLRKSGQPKLARKLARKKNCLGNSSKVNWDLEAIFRSHELSR